MARARRPQLQALPLAREEVTPEMYNMLVRTIQHIWEDQQTAFSNQSRIIVNGMTELQSECAPREVFIYEGHLVVNIEDYSFMPGLSVTASVGSVTTTIT